MFVYYLFKISGFAVLIKIVFPIQVYTCNLFSLLRFCSLYILHLSFIHLLFLYCVKKVVQLYFFPQIYCQLCQHYLLKSQFSTRLKYHCFYILNSFFLHIKFSHISKSVSGLLITFQWFIYFFLANMGQFLKLPQILQ